MIKNIVFDMGKVLLDYRERPVCDHFIAGEEAKKAVCTSVFVSPEWIMLDMGVISEERALAKMQARLESEEEKQAAAECLAHWHEYNMTPRSEMGELVRALKARGFGVYVCSNASLRLLECYKEVIPAIECFDGVLFSAEVKCMKPQKEMYQHFYERFHLDPQECFFIDDLPQNIEGAQETGMDGYCYADGDFDRLAERLAQFPNPI